MLQNFALDIDLKVKRFLSSTPNSTAYSLKKKKFCAMLWNIFLKSSGKISLSKWHALPQSGDVLLSFDPVKVIHSVTASGPMTGHCLRLALC